MGEGRQRYSADSASRFAPGIVPGVGGGGDSHVSNCGGQGDAPRSSF